MHPEADLGNTFFHPFWVKKVLSLKIWLFATDISQYGWQKELLFITTFSDEKHFITHFSKSVKSFYMVNYYILNFPIQINTCESTDSTCAVVWMTLEQLDWVHLIHHRSYDLTWMGLRDCFWEWLWLNCCRKRNNSWIFCCL